MTLSTRDRALLIVRHFATGNLSAYRLMQGPLVDAFVHHHVGVAEKEHVVRAPVRSRVVVPVQFVPNLIAALQEHLRVFSESYSNVGWTKADPIH